MKKGTIELVSKFNPIGLVEDFTHNNDSHGCKVSMSGKVRTVSVQSARKKIDLLRKFQGNLINSGNPVDENNLDNVFTTTAAAKLNDIYSLSMFSRAQSFIERAESHKLT